jgi:hypothetical protein
MASNKVPFPIATRASIVVRNVSDTAVPLRAAGDSITIHHKATTRIDAKFISALANSKAVRRLA